MERVTQRLRHDQMQAINESVDGGEFGNRSEAIRMAIDVLFGLDPDDAGDDDLYTRRWHDTGPLLQLAPSALEGRLIDATYERGGVELDAAGEIVAIHDNNNDRRTLVLDDGSRVAPADVLDYNLRVRTEVAP